MALFTPYICHSLPSLHVEHCITLTFPSFIFFPPSLCVPFCSRCERLPCNETSECLALPVRITYYHLTFPTNIPVPTNIFRMGPSNTVLGDNLQVAIVDGNQAGYFAAQRLENGGVIVVQKPISVPQDFEILLEMKLWRFGNLSTYLSKIRVFVTEEDLSNSVHFHDDKLITNP